MGTRRVNKVAKKVNDVFAPRHIQINGSNYEKISSNSVEVELELEEDVLLQIDRRIDAGEYVSRGDAIRDILRQMVEEQTKKSK